MHSAETQPEPKWTYKRKSQAEIQAALALRAQGVKREVVAVQFGVTAAAVAYWERTAKNGRPAKRMGRPLKSENGQEVRLAGRPDSAPEGDESTVAINNDKSIAQTDSPSAMGHEAPGL